MTIAAPALLTSGAIAAASSTVTSSITVTAGKPVAIAIVSEGSGSSTISSITGAGQTWTQAHYSEVVGEGGYTRLWLYTSPATVSGSGAVTITFSDGQENGAYQIVEVEDDITPPTFGTVVTSSVEGSTTHSLTVPALDGHSRYLTFAYYGEYPTTGLTGATPRTGWTEVGDTVNTGVSTTGLESQYSPLGGDTTTSVTFSHSGSIHLVALPVVGGVQYLGKNTGTAINGGNAAVSLGTLAAGDYVIGIASNTDYHDVLTNSPGVVESGWTELADFRIADTGGGVERDTVIGVYAKVMGATPDTTLTFVGSGNANHSISATVHAFRGVDPDNPVIGSVVTSSVANTVIPTFGSVTPGVDGAVVWVGAGGSHNRSTAGVYASSGLLEMASAAANDAQDAVSGAGYKRWVSGSYTPVSWTFGSTDSTEFSAGSVMVALRPEVLSATDTVAKCDAAAKVGSTVGKAHFIKHPSTDVAEGETLRFQTCFYLSTETSADFDGLKILDFENNDISGNPGFRIQVYNSGAYWGVTVNQDKLNGPVTTSYGVVTPDVLDQGLTFDEPHLLDVEVLVGGDTAEEASDTTDGHVKIWLDGDLVLDQDMRTTVTQAYWTGEGLPGSITAHVSSIQVGVTANSDETYNAVMYLGSSALLLPGGAWDLFSTWEEDPVTTGWTSTVTSSGSALTAVDAPATMIEPTMPATGSGAVSTATTTVSGVGTTTRKGTGGFASGAATVSGSGAVTRKGSGAIESATVTVAGAGKRTVTGAGVITIGAATVAGAGEGQTNGAGAITTGPAAVSGAGTRIVTGEGAISLPTATISGSGSVAGNVDGSGDVALPAATVSGAGRRIVTGSGAISVGAVAVAGAASGVTPVETPPARGGWGVHEEDADEGARRSARQRKESRDARSEAVRKAIEALNKAPEPDRPLPAKVVRRVARDAARELVDAGQLADLQAAIDRMEAVTRQYWADMRAERAAALLAERRRAEATHRARLARDDDDILALLLVA